MSDQIKDGGPAFPCVDSDSRGYPICAEYGMSLRDYFAAKAMPDLQRDGWGDDQIARRAYELAGAMLAAREATS